MIGRLIRYDNAMDKIWASWIVALGFGFGFKYFENRHPAYAYLSPADQPGVFSVVFIMLMFFLIFIMISTNITTRCSRISMILPIHPKRLWIARIVSIITASVLPVLIMTAVMAVRREDGGYYLDAAVLHLGARCAAGVVLAALLFQSWRVEMYRIPGRPAYVIYTIFVSLAVTAATFVGMAWTYTAPVFLVLSLLLALRVYLLLPDSFKIVPSSVNGTARSAAAGPAPEDSVLYDLGPRKTAVSAGGPVTARSGRALRLHVHISLIRGVLNDWKLWVYAVLVAFYVLMIVLTYHDGASKDNPYGLFIFVWIWMILVVSLIRMYRFEYLPVSRRTFFAYTWGMVVLAMVLGFVAGNILVSARSRNFRQLKYYDNALHIPDEFHEISTDGPPPELTSPWGETFAPEALQLFKGSDIYVYKPYDWGKRSSKRFVALQIDRAKEAVHGIPYDGDSMYDDIDKEYGDTIESCCFTLFTLGNSSEPRNRAFAIGATAAAAVFSLLMYLSLFSFRVIRFKVLANLVIPVSLLSLVVIVIAVIIAGREGLVEPKAIEMVPAIYIRKISQAIPVSTAGLWGLFALIFAAGSLLIYSGFRKAEAAADFQKALLKEY